MLERFNNLGYQPEDEFGSDLNSGVESEEEEDIPNKGARMGDIEWIAFEVFQDTESDDGEDEEDEVEEDSDIIYNLLPAISTLKLDTSPLTSSHALPTGIFPSQHRYSSLSLLEYLLRLAALQTFEQQSHMDLTDEHIVLFLRDDNPASRQQPAIEQERTLRRQSSQTSISSNFSSRVPHTQFPLSPPHTEEPESHPGTTPISSSPIVGNKPPVKRNTRTRLERAMAADYDPMTIVTPVSNRRITRNRKNILIPKRNSKDPQSSNSAPNSIQKSSEGTGPLVGKSKLIPMRRAVSGSAAGIKRTQRTKA